jgi:type I restriction enzyme R subunit
VVSIDDTPSYREDHASQIPAIQFLINLGYTYITPGEAVKLRGGKSGGVLLDGILEEQLRKLNKIRFKGQEYAFSEGNIQSAILTLKGVFYDGLVRTNEKIYDLLTLGRSLPQTILGDTKSFPLKYIDWERAGKPDDPNVYHVTAEYVVDRPGQERTPLPSEDAEHDAGRSRRPDIVLFVNGIPLCVIECKSPTLASHDKPIEQAISQMIRNQKDEGGIPRLFVFTQLLLAVAKNEAKYATCGTSAKFWAAWKEREDTDDDISAAVRKRLPKAVKDKLFTVPFRYAREAHDATEAAGVREVTAQDRAIYSLCRPERLLEIALRYTLFDGGEKKIARYQQYFTVKEIMERIRQRDADGRRKGGVVWHTQGSGKSLTMVMLAENIAMESALGDYKIVLVTDRVDLDDQLYKTFDHCGAEVEQARTGAHLGELMQGSKKRIITTIINKFESIAGKGGVKIDDPDIFVLVDESHRGQYGPMAAKMEQVLPRACFIGFTGTPVMKKDRNTIRRFGGLIPPPYTINEAVDDKAVVPLLYEGRHVEQIVNREQIDAWFERVTEALSKEQKADLKKKFARADMVNDAEQKIMRVAFDISEHFRNASYTQNMKGQLVASRKVTALLYKEYLDEFGMVTSEVLISGPDDREGEEDVNEQTSDVVKLFWQKMMAKYGTEKEYNKQVINAFKHGDDPQIIIVVDKLLTGFDAPRNTVLYLTRRLEDYMLLQAIARVNRLNEGKEFGYILDYRGVLGELDTAMALYKSLANYETNELEGTLIDVAAQIASLPQKHSELWAIFAPVRHTRDTEAYERLLADDNLREEFYHALSAFARVLGVAMSAAKFLEQTPREKVEKYKSDLKFFANLRTAVRRRYAEEIDFGEYEAKIQKLIDTHVGTGEVRKVTPLVNIFDKDAFSREVEQIQGTASKADTIAHRTKKTISERMAVDPAFYKKFSEMLEEIIRAFREQRLSDVEYLSRVTGINEAVTDRTDDDLPSAIRTREVAKAFYGIIRENLGAEPAMALGNEDAATAAIGIDEIVLANRIVDWTVNPDVQNRMKTEIEEFLFDCMQQRNLKISFDDLDQIIEQCLDVARLRYTS